MCKNNIKFFSLFGLLFLILFSSLTLAGELKVTNEHPFLVNNQWIEASQLKVGNYLTTIDGKRARITEIEDVQEEVEVYNLEDALFHNYVSNDIVVHNSYSPSSRFGMMVNSRYKREGGMLTLPKINEPVETTPACGCRTRDLETIVSELASKRDYESIPAKIASEARVSPAGLGQVKPRNLAEEYRASLITQGVYDPGYTFDFTSPAHYSLRIQYFLSFVEILKERFVPESRRVFLGSDGREYTKYAYDILNQKCGETPNSVHFEINRKMLATKSELEDILVEAEKLVSDHQWVKDHGHTMAAPKSLLIESAVSKLTSARSGGLDRIQLYGLMNKAVTSAATRPGEFYANLINEFNSIMTNPSSAKSRARAIELLGKFGNEVLSQNNQVVLVDYAGITHVQANLLKTGVEWLKTNWNSLTPQEQAILGRQAWYRDAGVAMHLGVTSIVVAENPLAGKGIPGVWSYPYLGDVVETSKSSFMDAVSLAEKGEVKYVPSDAWHKADTLNRQLIIAGKILRQE